MTVEFLFFSTAICDHHNFEFKLEIINQLKYFFSSDVTNIAQSYNSVCDVSLKLEVKFTFFSSVIHFVGNHTKFELMTQSLGRVEGGMCV